MARLLHLSDLHFGAQPAAQQERLLDALVWALEGREADLLVFTGDLFDSTAAQPAEAVRGFDALLQRILRALRSAPWVVLLPGNHDRRTSGIFAPYSTALFAALAEHYRGQPKVTVVGNGAPFLAQRLELPGVPAHVITYDTTYLPTGLVSAGGLVRSEDLLEAARDLLEREDDLPVLLLMHHHLVPTPVTDLGLVHVADRPWPVRWLVRHALPAVVPNADREELTMTALGSGTALSALHTFGRAVLVLHGHKHYPTARLLRALGGGEGDLLLLAAGSCGTAEAWRPSESTEAPRLWPSFNALDFDGQRLAARTVGFPPERGRRKLFERPLVTARRRGRFWRARTPREHEATGTRWLSENRGEFTLSPARGALGCYDVAVRRTVRLRAPGHVTSYVEVVEGPSDSRLEDVRHDQQPGDEGRVPFEVRVPLDGTLTYLHRGGLCATVAAGEARYGLGTAFDWVGVLNRYSSESVSVVLRAPPLERPPFASITDLMTGRERPLPLTRTAEGDFLAQAAGCRARVLLRIYLPLLP